MPPHKNTIEGTEKIEGQTNKQSLGLTKSRGRYCNTICMCGLSLAWVTSENSTMLLESSWLTLAGPYPMLPRLSAPVSGVDCPCPFFHAHCLLLLASLLSSHQLSLLSSRNCPLWVASSTLIRVPLPLPDTARFHVQESFVWFRAKTDNWIVCFDSPTT